MVVKINRTLTGTLDGGEGLDLFYATTGGIGNADIKARGGQNIVIGNNIAPFSTGIGISNSSISSTGSLTVIANGTTIGMAFTSIFGGDGVDHIIARGNLFGVLLAGIDGGGGNDTFDLQSGTGSVDGGSGIDTLILEGDRSDYTFTEGSGFNSPDNISSADGTDLDVENIEQFVLNGVEYTFDDLFGGDEPTPPPSEEGEIISRRKIAQQTIEGTDLSDSYQATQDGISVSTFETLGGDDLIRGFTADFSNASSAIGFSEIDTGDGDDMVIAESNTGLAAIAFTQINTGAGNDEITGMSSIGDGLSNVNIDAGSGDDYILAETTSQTLAINNSVLNGGDGNDTIELRGSENDGENNGRGTINGGSGDGDLLILGSSSSRYFYELGSSSDLTGTISTGGTTILEVEGVENFQFANELGTNYTFEQLFGIA